MNTDNSDAPQDVELNLPWYARGHLSAQERADVEAALAADPELRRRLALVEEEANETIALNESLKTAPASSLDRIMTKIDLYETAHPRRAGFIERALAVIARAIESLSPRNLAFAGIAAAAIICLQAGLLTGLLIHQQKSGPAYNTASTDIPETGTFALVAFNGSASWQQVTDFLAAQHAELRSGPKPGGFYRIKLSEQVLSPEALDARLADLRAHGNLIQLILPEPAKR